MTTSGQRTVLVAEADTKARCLFVDALTDAGYRVLEAADGVRLVRLVAEEPVDAVLLDVRLGGDDGASLARELRVDRPELRVALVSEESSAAEVLGTVEELLGGS